MNNFKNEKAHVQKFTPMGKSDSTVVSTFFSRMPKTGKDDPPEKLYIGGHGIGFSAKLEGSKQETGSNYGSSLLDTVEKLQALPKEQLNTPEMHKVITDLLDATNSVLGSMHERRNAIPSLLAQIDAKISGWQRAELLQRRIRNNQPFFPPPR